MGQAPAAPEGPVAEGPADPEGPADRETVAALERAAAAQATGNDEALLGALIDAWRPSRYALIGELIDQVSARLDGDRGPIPGAGSQALQGQWLAVAAAGDPADLGRLLAVAMDGRKVAEVFERIKVLEAWPDDPRLALALAAQIDAMPLRTSSAQKIWTRVFRIIPRCADRRVIALLEPQRTIHERLQTNVAYWIQGKVERWLAVLVERSLLEKPPPPEVTERCQAIGQRLAPAAAAVGRGQSAAELLEQIYKSPEDDGLRQVYADLLVAQGDPRGELINLQYQRLAGEQSRSGRSRERALLKQHAVEWLGPLKAVVLKDGMGFERGFLTRCRIKAKSRAELERVAGDPRWATVEELLDPSALALGPVMRSLRRLRLTVHGLAALAKSAEPRRFTSLTFHEGPRLASLDNIHQRETGSRLVEEDLDALLACAPLLPELRELTLTGHYGRGLVAVDPVELEPLFGSALFGRLERFNLVCKMREATPWVARLATTQAEVLTVQPSAWETSLGVWQQRYEGPRLERATITYRGSKWTSADPARDLSQLLSRAEPGLLRSLTISVRGPTVETAAESRALLRAELARHAGLEHDVPAEWLD